MAKSKKLLDPGPAHWTDVETKNLINIIRDNTSLYDSKNKYYKNRQYIENIWRDIDIHFHKPPGSSHEKWSRLRVTYRKYKTNKGTDTKLWKFYKQLDFLCPHLRQKKTQNSLNDSIDKILKTTPQTMMNEEVESTEEIEIFVSCDDIIEESNESIKNEEQLIHTTNNNRKKKKNIKYDEIHDAKMEQANEKGIKISNAEMNKNFNVCCCNNKNDPDIMYLNSILPDIKLMSRQKKGLFKIKLQQLIHNMLYANDE